MFGGNDGSSVFFCEAKRGRKESTGGGQVGPTVY